MSQDCLGGNDVTCTVHHQVQSSEAMLNDTHDMGDTHAPEGRLGVIRCSRVKSCTLCKYVCSTTQRMWEAHTHLKADRASRSSSSIERDVAMAWRSCCLLGHEGEGVGSICSIGMGRRWESDEEE